MRMRRMVFRGSGRSEAEAAAQSPQAHDASAAVRSSGANGQGQAETPARKPRPPNAGEWGPFDDAPLALRSAQGPG